MRVERRSGIVEESIEASERVRAIDRERARAGGPVVGS